MESYPKNIPYLNISQLKEIFNRDNTPLLFLRTIFCRWTEGRICRELQAWKIKSAYVQIEWASFANDANIIDPILSS